MSDLTAQQRAHRAAQDLASRPGDPETEAAYRKALAALPYYNTLTINGYLFRVRVCGGCSQQRICMYFAHRYLCRTCFPHDRATTMIMDISRRTWTLTIRPAYDEAYQNERLQEALQSCE